MGNTQVVYIYMIWYIYIHTYICAHLRVKLTTWDSWDLRSAPFMRFLEALLWRHDARHGNFGDVLWFKLIINRVFSGDVYLCKLIYIDLLYRHYLKKKRIYRSCIVYSVTLMVSIHIYSTSVKYQITYNMFDAHQDSPCGSTLGRRDGPAQLQRSRRKAEKSLRNGLSWIWYLGLISKEKSGNNMG